ncbi:hypothetical protein MFIFM68171_01970 [Madurella fahalii]|uniref:Uncharacterized protein n=1 Tax=Madurella fahalii TaxID=1157608 RepID=A0ABQ0G2H6_9PEZI
MSLAEPILAPLDTEDLRVQGLLHLGRTAGSHRLHRRRLNRSSDEEYQDIPLNTSPESPTAFVTIPAVLISWETLIYLGLSAGKAAQLWQEWSNWPDSGPRREVDADDGGLQVPFLDFIIGHIENNPDARDESDAQWRACMDACGLATDIQDAIMDPHFTYLRLSNSCLHWVKDTIEMRYAGLQDIQRTSRAREMELRRMASRSDGYQRSEGRDQGGYTMGSASSSTVAGQGQNPRLNFQRQSSPGVGPDIWSSVRALASRNCPGYTTLYKAMDQARMNGLFDGSGALSNIRVLLSHPPSDFSGTRSLFYFTPDIRVAEYYASYAKRRVNCESVVIMRLRIPNAAIESLSEPDIRRLYWPSNDWKELVWRSRTRQALPTRLRTYRDALLIIGTISRKPDAQYHALSTWENITERYVLKVGANGDGNAAVQYVINGEEEGCEWLEENGARNIQAFPYRSAQLQSWLAENLVP